MDTIKKGLIKCNFQDTNWHRSSLILFLYPDQNNLELYATLEKKQKKNYLYAMLASCVIVLW